MLPLQRLLIAAKAVLATTRREPPAHAARVGAAVLVLGALAAFAPGADATTPVAKRTGERSVTFSARSQLEHAQLVDNAPAGDSPGDVLVFTERLLDNGGKTIGSDAASCVRLFDVRSLCTGTYIFAAGQIMVQLVQPGPSGVYRQAVVGGTGDFAAARGNVIVDQRPDGDRFTFKIVVPAAAAAHSARRR